MSGELETVSAAVSLIQGLASKDGIRLDAGQILSLASSLIQSAVGLLDGHAKAQAAAAGDAAAAAVKTEDQAEAAQRKKP